MYKHTIKARRFLQVPTFQRIHQHSISHPDHNQLCHLIILIKPPIFSGIGEDESPRTALATVDSAVTAPPPNLDKEVDKLMMRRLIMMVLTMMFRLISCSVVGGECDATSAGASSQAKETRRAKDSTGPIQARRASVLPERPASGTLGSGAEAEPVSSENVSPPPSSLAPSAILSSPRPRATQETSRRLQHLLGSQLASAPQTCATLTSARRRDESCQDRSQPADRQQGGQRPGERQQRREERLGHQSLWNSHEGSRDCLPDRISTLTLLDCSATPAAPF